MRKKRIWDMNAEFWRKSQNCELIIGIVREKSQNSVLIPWWKTQFKKSEFCGRKSLHSEFIFQKKKLPNTETKSCNYHFLSFGRIGLPCKMKDNLSHILNTESWMWSFEFSYVGLFSQNWIKPLFLTSSVIIQSHFVFIDHSGNGRWS